MGFVDEPFLRKFKRGIRSFGELGCRFVVASIQAHPSPHLSTCRRGIDGDDWFAVRVMAAQHFALAANVFVSLRFGDQAAFPTVFHCD
ncbi:hypothetical protein [Thermomonas mangrovi]|uniref:hypothetical protein n=1 Tax=Thermomonas mangrovi TaxID=2993316 RepID=UPI002307D379|nr:hypothetical protein [Thermomonas mangrovi]